MRELKVFKTAAEAESEILASKQYCHVTTTAKNNLAVIFTGLEPELIEELTPKCINCGGKCTEISVSDERHDEVYYGIKCENCGYQEMNW